MHIHFIEYKCFHKYQIFFIQGKYISLNIKMIKYKYVLIECIYILLNINFFINIKYFSLNVNINY